VTSDGDGDESDTQELLRVTDHRDLQCPGVSPQERDVIAQLLSDGSAEVVWVPEWLQEDKTITTVEGQYRVAIGDVTRYSDDAFVLRQPGGDTGYKPQYLPVSEVWAWTLAEDVDSVETPQHSLGDYE